MLGHRFARAQAWLPRRSKLAPSQCRETACGEARVHEVDRTIHLLRNPYEAAAPPSRARCCLRYLFLVHPRAIWRPERLRHPPPSCDQILLHHQVALYIDRLGPRHASRCIPPHRAPLQRLGDLLVDVFAASTYLSLGCSAVLAALYCIVPNLHAKAMGLEDDTRMRLVLSA
ncbi:hypothetical protein C8R47DRAFT_1088154 [Mycena vitilis]|nr:hypothetical protein C8R47DRAFT_1088154 [Mycena vitilis]